MQNSNGQSSTRVSNPSAGSALFVKRACIFVPRVVAHGSHPPACMPGSGAKIFCCVTFRPKAHLITQAWL